MTKLRRLFVGTLLLGLVAGIVTTNVAFAQSESSSGDQEVTLRVGIDSDVSSLNPYNLCCGADYEVMSLMYDLAFNYDNSTLEAAPGLVQSWEPNEDYTEWTLTIADGATWTDGEPVTPEDVAFSFEVAHAIPYYRPYLPFDPTFTVTGDNTVVWTSTQPTFAPIVPAYVPIVPEHVWGQFVTAGDEKETRKNVKAYPNEEPVGSGMFKLEEYKQNQFIHLTANDAYWGEKPASLTDVIFVVFQTQEAMVQAIKNGEIDYAWGLKTGLYNSLEGQPNIATRAGDGGCWGNIAWNFGGQPGNTETHEPTAEDVKFRQAVAMSVDRQEIIEKVYQNTALEGYSILMPGTNGSWVTDIPEELQFNYDPDAANALLDEAGYVDTDNDGIRNGVTGDNLDLELLVITDVLGSVDTGKLLQGYLADIGVDSFLTTVNQDRAGDLWYTGEWDAYVWDWCPDPDPDFMLSVFTTDQCMGWSDGCYSNPEYDELYKLQQTQFVREERKATIDEMQLMIAEEIPTMVLNYWSDLSAYRTDKFDPDSWVPSPDNDLGLYLFGWTNDSYRNLRLIGNANTETASPGLPSWIWVAAGVAIVVVIGAVAMSRRKGDREDEA